MTDIALRIELLDTEPLVWRRFLVPQQINLHRLHQVIQIVMGWTDSHLYEFECEGRTYLGPDPFGDIVDASTAQAANVQLRRLLPRLSRPEFLYIYDFGDGWEHRIVVERSGLENSNPCPRLIDGAMACPPEDSGGPPGYALFKDALAGDADDEDEHSEMLLEMVGDDFDPSALDEHDIAAALQPIQAGFKRV